MGLNVIFSTELKKQTCCCALQHFEWNCFVKLMSDFEDQKRSFIICRQKICNSDTRLTWCMKLRLSWIKFWYIVTNVVVSAHLLWNSSQNSGIKGVKCIMVTSDSFLIYERIETSWIMYCTGSMARGAMRRWGQWRS